MVGVPCVILNQPQQALPAWLQELPGKHCKARLVRFGKRSALKGAPFTCSDIETLTQLINSSSEDQDCFAERTLDGQSYLLPAMYLGLFKAVSWCREPERRASITQQLSISLRPEERPFELICDVGEMSDSEQHISFDYQIASAEGVFHGEEPLVIEIDLSWFGGFDAPRFDKPMIELTQAGAAEYSRNPYHILRLLYGGDVKLIDQDGRSFLQFQCSLSECSDALPEGGAFIERIDGLVKLLARFERRLQLLTVVRGVGCGWYRSNDRQQLEQKLFDALRAGLDLEVREYRRQK